MPSKWQAMSVGQAQSQPVRYPSLIARLAATTPDRPIAFRIDPRLLRKLQAQAKSEGIGYP